MSSNGFAQRFVSGRSGNPSGRPKGFAGLARRIMEETGDGAELVTYALQVWRNSSGQRSHDERWAAFQWLADRGFGKALAMMAAHVYTDNEPSGSERKLRALTDTELELLAKLDDDAIDVGDQPAQLPTSGAADADR